MTTEPNKPHTPPTPSKGASPGVGAGDPFETLGLQPAFEIDRARVERAYLARVAAAHPDLAAGADGDDEDDSDGAASALNAAKATLLDDERRAIALLEHLGGSKGDPADARALPDGFLMEIMEVRESAEAAVASGDRPEIERWRAWALERRSGHRERVASLFEAGDPASLKRVRVELNAWRYIERMLEQLG